MSTNNKNFDEHEMLHDLMHYLPAQAPLKDFIHHNTLHAFQKLKFKDGVRHASEMFGYKVCLSLEEFRSNYTSGKIKKENLSRIIAERKGSGNIDKWLDNVIKKEYDTNTSPRIGSLRNQWKELYHINLDSLVHPIIFRILCCYLDQGISIWNFPVTTKGFITALRELEQNSYSSFFKTKRAKDLLLNTRLEIDALLKIIVSDESLYKQYVFDQQFAHQGWSGMVATIEVQPETLLDTRNINLKELIIIELLLEIDALDAKLGDNWSPLSVKLVNKPLNIFSVVPETELSEVLYIWQEASEWSYYDNILSGMKLLKPEEKTASAKTFQAMFCIDDRETSLRDYLEKYDKNCETYGTPGFFSAEFYFQPEGGKFYTKLCPAPVTPKYLIKELETNGKRKKDVHFTKHTHSLIRGWLISQTLGFWSALKLFTSIFRPRLTPATASSFSHMDKFSKLTIENKNVNDKENGLQIGFTVEEMTARVESLLMSIGLIKNFAPIVYVVGHGSSSVNNPHYNAYNCGACCGRPGSVNARVFSFMANHPEVRKVLSSKGIVIPSETSFIGGLHDTTVDDIVFYDEDLLSPENLKRHDKNRLAFAKALDDNSKERSRRFMSIDTRQSPQKIHEKIRIRAVSLFEPRPELNHATNALCIVGKRDLTKGLFLDRRAFTNSYDYKIDLDGKYLFNIMKPLGPVCGGINLEYFFSRVDNQKLGAGTKLPHNVMGLFGVANGIDGDLRPGLPSQMIEIHDPVRLLIIVEHFPEVVLETIKKNQDVYEWFINEWIHLISVNPETKMLSLFKEGNFFPYQPIMQTIDTVPDMTLILETHHENLPAYLIK
jgi:uncharacterized protein YbcC (UPF0753/DUF2309 family)